MRQATTGLHGAWLLARGQPMGLAYLAPSSEVAGSFWAIPLSLPAFVALRAIDWAVAGVGDAPGLVFLREMLALLIGWIGFLVLMHPLCRRMGLAERWPRFVIAWNWCSLLQALMAVVAALTGLLGAPDWIVQTAGLVTAGWSMWLGWFVTRLTLGVTARIAAVIVMLDVAVELLASGFIVG